MMSERFRYLLFSAHLSRLVPGVAVRRLPAISTRPNRLAKESNRDRPEVSWGARSSSCHATLAVVTVVRRVMMVVAAVATSVARHRAMLDVLTGVAAVAVASIVLVSLARAVVRPAVKGRVVVRVFGAGKSVVDVPMQVIELAVILLMLCLAGEA